MSGTDLNTLDDFAHRVLFGDEKQAADALAGLMADCLAEARDIGETALQQYLTAKRENEMAMRKLERDKQWVQAYRDTLRGPCQ